MSNVLGALAAIGIEEELWRVLHRTVPHLLGDHAHWLLLFCFGMLGWMFGMIVRVAEKWLDNHDR